MTGVWALAALWESRLCYMGHVLMENRNGIAVAGDVMQATGTAGRMGCADCDRLFDPAAAATASCGGDRGGSRRAQKTPDRGGRGAAPASRRDG